MARWYDVVDDFGADPTGATDTTTAVQNAMNNAVGTLYFPQGTYRVGGAGVAALTLSRNINLLGAGTRSTVIRGDNLGATTDLLKVAFTDNFGSTDVRNWRMSDLRLQVNTGGRHGFIIDHIDCMPIYSSEIVNCNINANVTNGGYSIYMLDSDGTVWAHSRIALNTIQSSMYVELGDANVIEKNLFFGTRCAMTVNLHDYGIRNNTIRDNTISNRDGAVHVQNGDNIRIVNNQIELATSQGASQSATSSMIWLQGVLRPIRNCVIEDNNFGGGTNLNHLIYLDNTYRTVVSKNHLIAVNVAEIFLTANARYDIIKFDNTVETQVSNPRTRTKFMAQVSDAGQGTAGVLKAGSTLGLQNGWTGGDYYKDEAGMVHFNAALTGGSFTTGAVIGTFPLGFRPPVDVYIPCGTTLRPGLLKIVASTGVLSVARTLAANANVWPQSFPCGTVE